MSRLNSFFAECTRVVDESLENLIPDASIEPTKLHEAIRWSLFAGGKRFRPALLIAVGDAFGAERKKLLRTAAAVEMIHTYSLVHDDLPAMDDDNLRRGRETCHIKFDEATAILAGDALNALAFQTIGEDENLSAETRVKLIAELARASGTPFGMIAGQQLDVEAEGKAISIEQLEQIHQSKTGAIISFAAKAGAIIANANETESNAIANYAGHLGLLFQITDDLLDITQTTATLGKTAGKDTRAAKATYPAFYGLAETKKLAENIHAAACQDLEKVEKDSILLRKIADFILQRKK